MEKLGGGSGEEITHPPSRFALFIHGDLLAQQPENIVGFYDDKYIHYEEDIQKIHRVSPKEFNHHLEDVCMRPDLREEKIGYDEMFPPINSTYKTIPMHLQLRKYLCWLIRR